VIRSRQNALVKRALDVFLVLASVPFTLPAFLVSALLVRMILGRPIFFVQERAGLHGQSFSLLKLRSMRPEFDAEGNEVPISERITAFGRFLRSSSLDELPQLINVLKGDMSLVGPRPLYVEYLPYYSEEEHLRHLVRPGITGAAQVNGRNSLDWDTRLALDVEYARSATLRDDVRIILQTVARILDRSDTVPDAWDHFEALHVYRGYPRDADYALRRLEFRDAGPCVGFWLQNGLPAELDFTGELDEEGFRSWLRHVREEPSRQDLAVYEMNSKTIVAAAGCRWSEAEAGYVSYMSVLPSPDEPGVHERVRALLNEHLVHPVR